MMPSENQSFLDEGATSGQQGLGVLGGEMTRPILGVGVWHTKGGARGHRKKLHFQHIHNTLKGTWEFTDLIKNQV